jgi:UDP-glucuronate 4-epimerase
MNMMPMQPGDVLASYADIDDLQRDTGYQPKMPIKQGIANFVSWYRQYHQL